MFKKIIDAVIGYSGSSQDPSVMSMRFSAIIVAVIAKATTIAAVAGYVIPFSDAQAQALVGSLALVGASMFWLFGLVRYVVKQVQG